MKKITILFLLAVTMQFSFGQEGKKYEFMTIVVVNDSYNYQITISKESGVDYRTISREKTINDSKEKAIYRNKAEYVGLIKVINQFSIEGWELVKLLEFKQQPNISNTGKEHLFYMFKKEKYN
ncbi:MAG: hypothetical protein AB8B61_02550 [Cyclobacteriaceae bacterium]